MYTYIDSFFIRRHLLEANNQFFVYYIHVEIYVYLIQFVANRNTA